MVVPSLWLLCAACLLAAVQGFASYMTTKHCDRTLIGEMIMAKEAVADATRTIQVSRGDSPVQNGTVIGDLSGLSVRLEPKLFQVLFEVEGASFRDGACNGRRSNKHGAELVNTGFEGEVVRIVAAWAKGYSSGVKISDPFYLHLKIGEALDL